MHHHTHGASCCGHAGDIAFSALSVTHWFLLGLFLIASLGLLYYMLRGTMNAHKHDHSADHSHEHSHDKSHSQHHSPNHSHGTIQDELLCHFPYAVIAVVSSLALLSLLGLSKTVSGDSGVLIDMFHTFHFLHLIFAATGTVYAYRQHARGLLGTFVMGSVVPLFFCTLSDAVMPYLGGRLCGLDMVFHWCLTDHFSTIAVFILIGILNGYVVSIHGNNSKVFSSHFSHFAHIFISAFASALYLVGSGFTSWSSHAGFVFLYLLVAVLVPCTLADVVVPLWWGMRRGSDHEEHTL